MTHTSGPRREPRLSEHDGLTRRVLRGLVRIIVLVTIIVLIGIVLIGIVHIGIIVIDMGISVVSIATSYPTSVRRVANDRLVTFPLERLGEPRR